MGAKQLPSVPAPSFTREGWDLVLQRWDDQRPRQTYEEFLAQERKVVDALQAQGIGTEIIPIDAAKMLSWLAKEELKNDGQGRAKYLAEAARCRNIGRPEPA
jgi:hypothetical protein